MYTYYPVEPSPEGPVFLLNAVLMIPKVAIQPPLDDVQEVLSLAGKHITSVSKGVAQWSGGKPRVCSYAFMYSLIHHVD